MNTIKMTADDKMALIATHKIVSMMDPGGAAETMIQALGKFLHDGNCTPQDAADVLLALYDEEKGERVDRIMETDPLLGLL